MYAEEIGADYVIMINPKFYFEAMTDEGVFEYYKYISDRVNIGIALFNQVEQGYLMSPELVAKIASLENVVAIKNIAPASHIMRTRILCGAKIVVSDAFEVNWFTNLTVRGQSAMIATVEPFCLQSKKSWLIKEYTDFALNGDILKAYESYKKLEPVRRALLRVTVPGKEQATYKYWAQYLGMAGGDGRVRLPQMELTEREKDTIESAVKSSGLV